MIVGMVVDNGGGNGVVVMELMGSLEVEKWKRGYKRDCFDVDKSM